jgi:hypothetical protein
VHLGLFDPLLDLLLAGLQRPHHLLLVLPLLDEAGQVQGFAHLRLLLQLFSRLLLSQHDFLARQLPLHHPLALGHSLAVVVDGLVFQILHVRCHPRASLLPLVFALIEALHLLLALLSLLLFEVLLFRLHFAEPLLNAALTLGKHLAVALFGLDETGNLFAFTLHVHCSDHVLFCTRRRPKRLRVVQRHHPLVSG